VAFGAEVRVVGGLAFDGWLPNELYLVSGTRDIGGIALHQRKAGEGGECQGCGGDPLGVGDHLVDPLQLGPVAGLRMQQPRGQEERGTGDERATADEVATLRRSRVAVVVSRY
jgi:hypothetical protein